MRGPPELVETCIFAKHNTLTCATSQASTTPHTFLNRFLFDLLAQSLSPKDPAARQTVAHLHILTLHLNLLSRSFFKPFTQALRP